MNTLKEAVILFKTNQNLQNMKLNQENLKNKSDQMELFEKQLDQIPEEQLNIMYQFSTGQIDQNTAIAMIDKENEKVYIIMYLHGQRSPSSTTSRSSTPQSCLWVSSAL